MIVHVDGRTACGGVVDLWDWDPTDEIDGAALHAAIRGDRSPYGVHCQSSTEVHDRAGFVRPGMGIATRTALAAAGRSRGLPTPHDQELASVRSALDALRVDLDPPDEHSIRPETGPTPRDADRERLRERVAELRGRIQALEGVDRDASDARSTLRDAARRLSELETERLAATETREQARSRRDRREKRLRLEDRKANLERAARAHLVDELHDEFTTAVDRVPATPDDDAEDAAGDAVEDPFAADPVTAALAVLHVADVRAPVVLAVDRFGRPRAAADWLDAPVIRL